MKHTILILVTALHIHLFAQNKLFEFREHKISSGEKKSFIVPVKSNDGDSTSIPITILNGEVPGPVLGLVAGIHGYEYPPIIAMQKFPAMVNLKLLKGTIIVVHMASVNAFFRRSVFYNPADGKNLNRVFPGNQGGSITECIAYLLSTEIIPRCQFIVDIHAGDASEDLHPYVAYYKFGTQSAKARKMALSLGFQWVIISENNPVQNQSTKYLTAQSVSNDIPTVAIEYGKLGQVTTTEADFINARLINMMRAIEIYEGSSKVFGLPIEITKRTSISAEQTGVFYSDLKSGQPIKKGTKLGLITDVFGHVLQEIFSPVEGFIIYKCGTPPINKGEIIFSLAEKN